MLTHVLDRALDIGSQFSEQLFIFAYALRVVRTFLRAAMFEGNRALLEIPAQITEIRILAQRAFDNVRVRRIRSLHKQTGVFIS